MTIPLVSIIMPAYNAEQFISESIESVINQTFNNWELIIIDDGSTDNTKVICEKYGALDDRIFYLYQNNQKQGKARNKGILHSRGKFIAFLDADDLWLENKLQIQVAYLDQHPVIDLIFTSGYDWCENKISNFDIVVKPFWDKRDLTSFIELNKIPILSVLVKKSALQEVGNFIEDEHVQNVEDYHLWLKLLVHNFKFASINDRLFKYRRHSQQVTQNDTNNDLKHLNLYKIFYNYHSEVNCNKQILKKVRKGIFNDKNFAEVTLFCAELLKASFYKRYQIFRLVDLLPNTKFKKRIIFQLLKL